MIKQNFRKKNEDISNFHLLIENIHFDIRPTEKKRKKKVEIARNNARL